MHWLADQRIITPGYSTIMKDIVGGALANEQRRLTGIVDSQVDESAKAALNRLVENPQGLHEITCSSLIRGTSVTMNFGEKLSAARKCGRCTNCRRDCWRA